MVEQPRHSAGPATPAGCGYLSQQPPLREADRLVRGHDEVLQHLDFDQRERLSQTENRAERIKEEIAKRFPQGVPKGLGE
jgi:hypothetical protein